MLVFRDGRRTASGPRLLNGLTQILQRLSRTPTFNESLTIDALLCAGELECALADAQSTAAAPVTKVTDALAAALVRAEPPHAFPLHAISGRRIPEKLTVSRPEGFSYYALHPLDFADVVRESPACSCQVAVIGIRSIGSTLSAIVAAAAQNRGSAAERITVRPSGHPWDRRLEFTPHERTWICKHNERRAEFWVVDEGPGLSGSSFLAVAEALVAAGVPRDRITLLGSAPPELSCLRAPNAAVRWRNFQSHFTRPQRRIPTEAAMSICAGEWRQLFLNGERWPAVWMQFERAKFLSADHKALLKFEGFGPYGAEVRERSARIAESGFGPQIGNSEIGYARYALVKDSILCATDVSEQVLEQLAAYCAWRAQMFPAETDAEDEIEQMVHVNASEALDTDIEFFTPRIERRVIVDGRMHPHEWRLTRAGRLLKFDAASHGDDHFFPGPTDIAWDLAGTIIEWDLNGAATEHFLETYRKASGDDPGNRLPPFLTAYALFRLGYCSMATESLRGTGEEKRFECQIQRYRTTSFRSMAHLQSA